MTRDELIRKLRRLAQRRGIGVDRRRGKGGHWIVQFGVRRQPVPQVKGRDLATGTLHGILRRFGLSERDLLE